MLLEANLFDVIASVKEVDYYLIAKLTFVKK